MRRNGLSVPPENTDVGAVLHQSLILHSDNSAPMKSSTLKAKIEELGIMPSDSKPRVSNDNPYVESLFRTFKYVPNWHQ